MNHGTHSSLQNQILSLEDPREELKKAGISNKVLWERGQGRGEEAGRGREGACSVGLLCTGLLLSLCPPSQLSQGLCHLAWLPLRYFTNGKEDPRSDLSLCSWSPAWGLPGVEWALEIC